MIVPAIHVVPLAICLGAAACWDLAKRTIPNVLTVSVATLGVGVQVWDNGCLAALSGLAAAVLSIIVLYRAWLAGGIGGGDVKLAAASAIWIGLPHFVGFALATAIAGGVVAVICFGISGRGARQQIQANLTGALLMQQLPVIDQRSPTAGGTVTKGGGARVSVPYGIAVAIGAGMALWAPWGL